MIFSRVELFRTFVRAEASSSFSFARKSAKRFVAALAGQLSSGYETGVSTFPRAVTNCRTFMFEHFSASIARDWFSRVGETIKGLAWLAAEAQRRVFFHDMTRPLKRFGALSANKRRPVYHRFRMARLTAEDRGRVISLKFLPTLGACLEQN
jgi:hypothetical protein